MAFLDETGLTELWSLIKAEDDIVEALANTKAKIEIGSYDGTNTYGKSKPCSLTFDFAPKLVIMLAQRRNDKEEYNIFFAKDTNGTTTYSVMIPEILTTSYALGVGFSCATTDAYFYGKKSSDGKTIYWYHQSGASEQFNYTNSTYYYMAIG